MAVQTTEFSNKDVTLNRNQFIGGSDIAAIMGLSRWKTPLKLWCEKTGKLEAPDLSDVEAVKLGNELEEFVAKKFTSETGKAVRRSPKYYQHPNYPFMVAHVDRLVTGTDELLECKTCSTFKKDEWQGEEIPQEYILQVMWYLGITGRRIGHIACLIGGQKFVTKQIEFDSELFDQMVEQAKVFWELVQNDEPPAISSNDDDVLVQLFSGHSEEFIELEPVDERTKQATDDMENTIAHLQEIKREIEELKKERQEIETSLKGIIKDHIGILTPKYRVTWKMQKTARLDSIRLKLEQPATYADFLKETTSRVMRIALNK